MYARITLGLTLFFFLWYSFAVLLVPFFDADHPVVSYFPGPHITLLVPALFGMFFIGALLMYTLWALYSSHGSQ